MTTSNTAAPAVITLDQFQEAAKLGLVQVQGIFLDMFGGTERVGSARMSKNRKGDDVLTVTLYGNQILNQKQFTVRVGRISGGIVALLDSTSPDYKQEITQKKTSAESMFRQVAHRIKTMSY